MLWIACSGKGTESHSNSCCHTAILCRLSRLQGPPWHDEWRFIQDLQAVNAAVKQRPPDMLNPYTILSRVLANTEWFSVVDIDNAFFSILLDKESQFEFALMFDGRPYTFTHLC